MAEKSIHHRLSRSFFDRSTLQVCRELLGKVLVVGPCAGRINEVEAYIGQSDPACHAKSGKTSRNKTMFELPGHLYVYFTYGMYYCMNIVTEKEGFPAAILIRSIEPLKGIEIMKKRRGKIKDLANGPGKLCIALDINRTHDGLDLCQEGNFYISDDGFTPSKIQISSRIGIRLGVDKLWRFFY